MYIQLTASKQYCRKNNNTEINNKINKEKENKYAVLT